MSEDTLVRIADRETAFCVGLYGRINMEDFLPWMIGHARKLDVSFEVKDTALQSVFLRVLGPTEMVEAFALACSLGPESVYIEKMVLTPVPSSGSSDGNLGNLKLGMQP